MEFYGFRLVFTTRKSFTMATHPRFQRDYEKVTGLTQSGDFAGAEAAVQELINNRIVTVFEYAFLNEALALAPERGYRMLLGCPTRSFA